MSSSASRHPRLTAFSLALTSLHVLSEPIEQSTSRGGVVEANRSEEGGLEHFWEGNTKKSKSASPRPWTSELSNSLL